MKFNLPVLLTCCTLVATTVFGNEPTASAVNNSTTTTVPHCEVPCGIYSDQHRFEEMLEDTATIAKSIASIKEITDGLTSAGPTPKSLNQSVRWVTTKESHATNIQHIVSQYFLTQRIKADNENYGKQLAASHAVLVAAMKCKQDADPATAVTLKEAIYNLYRAYEGKEPQLGHDHSNKK